MKHKSDRARIQPEQYLLGALLFLLAGVGTAILAFTDIGRQGSPAAAYAFWGFMAAFVTCMVLWMRGRHEVLTPVRERKELK